MMPGFSRLSDIAIFLETGLLVVLRPDMFASFALTLNCIFLFKQKNQNNFNFIQITSDYAHFLSNITFNKIRSPYLWLNLPFPGFALNS